MNPLQQLSDEDLQTLLDEVAERRRLIRIDAEAEAMSQAAKEDFAAFVTWTHPGYQWTEFHIALAALLQWISDEILAGRAPRVCVHAPPQHGKTAQISERFGVWHMARAMRRGIVHDVILAAYSGERAERNGGVARAVARAVSRHWPELARPPRGDDSKSRWSTEGGARLEAAGRGGPLTGEGGHLGICDDPLKDSLEADSKTVRNNCDNWMQSTFMTRIRGGGGVIVLMTRWNKDDQVGRLIARGWHYVCFAAVATEDDVGKTYIPGCDVAGWRTKGEALAPALFDRAALDQKRRDVTDVNGERWWLAMYQGSPTNAEGKLYRRGYFSYRYDHDPQRPPIRYGVVSLVCDANFKKTRGGANAVIHAWARGGMAGDDYHLLDEPLSDSVEYHTLLDAMYDAILMWTPDEVVIEDKANGSAMLADLEKNVAAFARKHGIRRPTIVRFDPGNTTKQERAQVTSKWWRSGRCHLPTSAPWIPAFVEEHVEARDGSEKFDRIDTQSMYLMHATSGGDDGRSALERARILAQGMGG